MTERTLYTIGYEKALLKDMLATLAAAGVANLLDVRDRPISRRPGFSKRQLAAAVEEAGMRYFHLGRSAPRRRAEPPTADANGIVFGLSSGRSWPASTPNSTSNRPPGWPWPHRVACYAMKPIGKSATAAASPKSSRNAMVLRCPT
jgi:hypothetical protein